MNDHELAHGCLKGNREAQKALFTLHAKKMMSVCLRYCNNREEAEDVLQDGFIKVFEKIHQWEGKGPLGGWIRTIMVNTALTHLRTHKNWQNTTDIQGAVQLENDEADALEQMNASDLMALISTLPLGYRTVFNLFAIEGFAHKEIAEQLGISENTSKTQFLKAKAWLKRSLEQIEKTSE
jgi:RNA polymerase sigma factor (sigma-70 family)